MQEVYILTPEAYKAIDWTIFPNGDQCTLLTEGMNAGNYSCPIDASGNDAILWHQLEQAQTANLDDAQEETEVTE